jgi:hypothetical protein
MNALKKLEAICKEGHKGNQYAYVNYCIAARTSFGALIELCKAQRAEIKAMKHLRRTERERLELERQGRDSGKPKAQAHIEAQRKQKAATAAVKAAFAELEAVCA